MSPYQNLCRDHARKAGLRYVYDSDPGFMRKKHGKGFSYVDAQGKTIKTQNIIERIQKLAIPPAWKNVWICELENGHIQATGYDERGRKQYRYHEKWREARDVNKFSNMAVFARSLPIIRRRVSENLKLDGLPREKVISAVIRLLDKSGLRIGNAEYEASNKSYGLTTLRKKHVDVNGKIIELTFKGKGGKEWSGEIEDPKVADIIAACDDLPGYRLFQYINGDGKPHVIESFDVNAMLQEWTGESITAKDFRTWHACTRFMEEALKSTQDERKLTELLKTVADELGNTPAMVRKAYVHPMLVSLHKENGYHAPHWSKWLKNKAPSGLHKPEGVLLRWLDQAA